MLIQPATTRECERLFRREVERRGHRFDRYKKQWRQPAAALAVVQAQNHETVSGVTADTVNITTTAGNLLVAQVRQGSNNTSTATMSDSSGTNVWTQTASGYNTSASTTRSAMFFVPNAAAVTSITVTWSGVLSTRVSIMVYEISGAAASSVLDSDVNSSNAANATSLTSGSLTTANANDILIYAVNVGADQTTWTVGAGYTFPANATGNRQAMQYQIVSATQSAVTTSMTWGATTKSASFFAAFKAAASGLLPNIDFVPGGGRGIDPSCTVSY